MIKIYFNGNLTNWNIKRKFNKQAGNPLYINEKDIA